MDKTNEDILVAKLDQLEVERIEASLNHTFAALGPVERIHGEDGFPWGWTVLGSVMIERTALPVDAGFEDESECMAERRQEILDIIQAAYMAGRSSAETHEDVDQDLEKATAKLAALHEEFDANEARIARALRGSAA